MQRLQFLKRSHVLLRNQLTRAQQSTPQLRQALRVQSRSFASLPCHEVVGLPALSPTMETGTIASWKKREGDLISAGDIICQVETDKAVVDFEAQDDYYMAKILKPEGTADIKIGEPIFVSVEDEADVAAFSNFQLDSAPAAAPAVPAAPKAPKQAAPAKKTAAPAATPASSGDRLFASPLAKKLAREAGVSLDSISVTASGPHGRVIADDVRAALASGAASQPAAAQAAQTQAAAAPVATAAVTGDFTDIPMSNEAMTRGQQLAQQKLDVPHYHLSVDLTLDKLLSARDRLNAGRDDKNKLSVNDFIIRAAALAMRKVPDVNSCWKGTFIRRYHDVNVNLVVSDAASGGTVAPIVRQVNQKGLAEISNDIRGIMSQAQENKEWNPEQLVTGTFTISNVGMYDVRSLSAIVTPEQACSLGLGTIETKVVPNDDPDAEQIYKYAKMMTATLACDHRVVDGAVGAQWLAVFKELVEDPLTMIL